MPAQVQLVQFLAPLFRGLLFLRLQRHDLHSSGAGLVDILFQELLDLSRGGHGREFLGKRENLAHADTHEEITLAVVTLTGLEIPLVLGLLDVGLPRVEPCRNSTAVGSVPGASAAFADFPG